MATWRPTWPSSSRASRSSVRRAKVPSTSATPTATTCGSSLSSTPPATASTTRGIPIATLARRPAAVLAIAAVLTAVLALGFVTYKPLGLQGLQTDASVDLLADPGSPAFADQVLFANSFGADPLVIEVEAQPGKDLLTGDHFIGLAALEGDIAGRPGVKKVYGPGTVGNELALEGTKRGL